MRAHHYLILSFPHPRRFGGTVRNSRISRFFEESVSFDTSEFVVGVDTVVNGNRCLNDNECSHFIMFDVYEAYFVMDVSESALRPTFCIESQL